MRRYIQDYEEYRPAKAIRPPHPLPEASPGLTQLAQDYISRRGLSVSLALHNGWYASQCAGDSFPRVVIPALNRQGTPFWQARLIENENLSQIEISKNGHGKGALRYQSPAGNRGDSLIIVRPLKPNVGVVTISEGPFDALAMAELGYESVALMGNAPQNIVWDHLWERYKFSRLLILVSDQDSLDATVKWQAHLAIRGLKTYIVVPKEAKDAAGLTLEQRKMMVMENSN